MIIPAIEPIAELIAKESITIFLTLMQTNPAANIAEQARAHAALKDDDQSLGPCSFGLGHRGAQQELRERCRSRKGKRAIPQKKPPIDLHPMSPLAFVTSQRR